MVPDLQFHFPLDLLGEQSNHTYWLVGRPLDHSIQARAITRYAIQTLLDKGCSEAQMMEAVHVAAAVRGGASLVHGVQMMNKAKEMVGG